MIWSRRCGRFCERPDSRVCAWRAVFGLIHKLRREALRADRPALSADECDGIQSRRIDGHPVDSVAAGFRPVEPYRDESRVKRIDRRAESRRKLLGEMPGFPFVA